MSNLNRYPILQRLLDEAIPKYRTTHAAIALGCEIWKMNPDSMTSRQKGSIRAYVSTCIVRNKDVVVDEILALRNL